MDLLVGSLVLRPYVFLFLGSFLALGMLDLGWRRTVAFCSCVWPAAWLAEFTSTRFGVPFGLYHYTGVTRGRELYFFDAPFFDSLSFTFLAYAGFCLARVALPRRSASRLRLAVVAGMLMMALDVVIDPLAVRGDQWFLGRIFYYAEGGVYFGVPLSNFLGWVIVGAIGVGGYLVLIGDASGRRPTGGVALYYAVVGFNVAVTTWIGEWRLAAVGLIIHTVLATQLAYLSQQRAEALLDLGGRGIQRA
jgi:uncharacterized membrane protein